MLKLIQNCNIQEFANGTLPLLYRNIKVGYCKPEVVWQLKKENLPDLICKNNHIEIVNTAILQSLLVKWKQENTFECLKGWRHELYPVCTQNEIICTIERSGCGLFGIRTYGVHINGYTIIDNTLHMWVATRSRFKQTYPLYLDQMVAGGISHEESIQDAVIRECEEEASIPEEISKNAIPVGLVSYFIDSSLGYCPETQYCYDLQLDPSFKPIIKDNEVEKFELFTIHQIKELLLDNKFKPNCALVVIDFLIRHGFITPSNDKDYIDIVESLKRPLSKDLPPKVVK